MTTSSHNQRMEPFYKQHGAVDDICSVVVDIDITTGQDNEGSQLIDQIKRIENNTGKKIKTLSADAGYAHGRNYQHLEQNNIDAIIPPQKQGSKSKCIPARLFKYDTKNKIIKCPAGKILTKRSETKQGFVYRTMAKDCRNCQLRDRCFSENSKTRSVLISKGYESLLRARRRHLEPDKKFLKTYGRHRYQIEGMHGEAKTQHGLRRAVRRGLANVSIQAYLTATVINLKRLAKYSGGIFTDLHAYLRAILLTLANIIALRGVSINRPRKLA